jgi:hypothetical protein
MISKRSALAGQLCYDSVQNARGLPCALRFRTESSLALQQDLTVLKRYLQFKIKAGILELLDFRTLNLFLKNDRHIADGDEHDGQGQDDFDAFSRQVLLKPGTAIYA